MEEIKISQSFSIAEIKHYAIYDVHTRQVIGVYPEASAKNLTNKVLIDREQTENFFDGILPMHTCYVEEVDGILEVVQTQVIKKIDDILHRIPDKEFSNVEDTELLIQFNVNSKKIIFSLSSKMKLRKVKWNNDVEARFVISKYNDPYNFFQIIQFKINDLYNSDLVFDYLGNDTSFSIFTSRIFKKNIIEKI
jgi:hypothetical protein